MWISLHVSDVHCMCRSILFYVITFCISTLVFQEAGVDLDKPVVATCGSGITACWIVVAGLLCGMKSVPLYDVSGPVVYVTPVFKNNNCCIEGCFHQSA